MSGTAPDAVTAPPLPSEDGAGACPESVQEKARDHAWEWFKYHADQRISMMRFYILSLGGVAGGIGYLFQQQAHTLSAVMCLFAALMSYCFMRLDKRTSDLVKLGEKALRYGQERLSKSTGEKAFNICAKADEHKEHWPYSYSQILRLLLRSAIALFIGGAFFCAANSKHILFIIHGRNVQ